MYTVEQDSNGEWMVIRPGGTVLARCADQAEAERLAYAYNVTFGFVKPKEVEA